MLSRIVAKSNRNNLYQFTKRLASSSSTSTPLTPPSQASPSTSSTSARAPQKRIKSKKSQGTLPSARPSVPPTQPPLLPPTPATSKEGTTPTLASLLLPLGWSSRSAPRRVKGSPQGQAIALTTADNYDTPSLLRGLHALGLLATPGTAVNLLGEAIYLPSWSPPTRQEGASPTVGEVFIFESGSIVTWGLGREGTDLFLRTVIRGRGEGASEKDELGWVERGRYKESEVEVLDYWVDSNRETQVTGDSILLSSAPSSPHLLTSPTSNTNPSHDLLTRLAFSTALARCTKLGVYETQFAHFADGTAGIPALLESGSESPVKKEDIIKRFGTLHGFRQKLNLEDEGLLDEPEFLWEDEGLHAHHDAICKALEFDTRLETLNQRVDYAFQLQSTLMDLLNTKTSHRLEWIIILLIAFEITIVLIREGVAFLHEEEESGPAGKMKEKKVEVEKTA
ncbi:hypothetical protein T439DRAFT_344604 [Meredithblackwellia eburnea MCA 4105]